MNDEYTNLSTSLSQDGPSFCTCNSGQWEMSSMIYDLYPKDAVMCETFPAAHLCNPCLPYSPLL